MPRYAGTFLCNTPVCVTVVVTIVYDSRRDQRWGEIHFQLPDQLKDKMPTGGGTMKLLGDDEDGVVCLIAPNHWIEPRSKKNGNARAKSPT